MDLSLRAMRYVSTAMTKGSISAAAEALNIAPSAVSVALDQAEAAFGMTLVIRARAKGISPTPAGRVILQRIEDLLDRYEDMLSNGAEMQAQLTGLLKVGYYAPIAPAFLPHILAPMVRDNPDLAIALEECDNLQAQSGLLDGNYDAVLFVTGTPHPQISVSKLIDAPSYCLCPADHPFAKRASITMQDLVREPLVILDRPVATAFYRHLLESEGQMIKVAATANSTEMVRSLVGAGLGCSILNMRPHGDQSYGGDRVVAIPIAGDVPALSLSLGVIRGPQRRILRAFHDACTTYFASPKSHRFIIE